MRKVIVLGGIAILVCVLVLLSIDAMEANDEMNNYYEPQIAYVPDDYYTLKFDNTDEIVKILYQHVNGDMYEITDKEVIKTFIDAADGTKFRVGECMEHSSWSPSAILLCNEKGEYVNTISVLNDNAIVYGDIVYEYHTDDGYGLELLEDKGVLIENIYHQ